jgi:polar amino acid transport system substrate-binding protein
MSRRILVPATVAVLVLSACSQVPGATPTPTLAPSPTSAVACTPQDPSLKVAGRLTIGTDNPAYPPYFDPPASGETASTPANGSQPWELGDPTNGRGFESAVAYAVAGRLGFTDSQVAWIYVPFDSAYAPGPKDFDFDINQVSYTAERAQQVDMSEGYYYVNQALVANAGTPITSATTIDDVKTYRLGAATGTTSLDYIKNQIAPDHEPMVYNDNDGAIAALNAGQIDGIVVDLPTAFYIKAAQMDNGVIVGQFAPSDQDQEYFSLVLEQDSPLTDCVNGVIDDMWNDGTLDDITTTWLSDKADAPYIDFGDNQ